MGGYGALLLGARAPLLRDRRPLAGALVQRRPTARAGRIRRRRGLRAPRHRQPPAALLRAGLDRRRHERSVPQRRRPLRARGPRAAPRLAGRARQRLLARAHARSTLRSMPGTAPDPKIELHVHLEGTVRPDTLRAIAKRNDYALPDDLESLYRFRDFAPLHRGLDPHDERAPNGRRLPPGRDRLRGEAASHGAVYLEAIFSPPSESREASTGTRSSAATATGREEARELHGVEVRLTPDIYRASDTRSSAEQVGALLGEVPRARSRRRGARRAGGGVPAGAVRAGVRAREVAGPRLGAACGRGRRRRARCAARSRRSAPTGSGTGSARSRTPGLVAELAGRGTVLDVCPLSNLRTGAVALARGAPAAAARRRRRPLLDLDRRPGDVRHRPDARLRGGRLARRLPARRVRGRRSPARSATTTTRDRLRQIGDSHDWLDR